MSGVASRQPASAPATGATVIDLAGHRQRRAGQVAAPEAGDRDKATRRRRHYIGRALRISEIAQRADHPATWRRAAALIHRVYETPVRELIEDLAAECALLSIEEIA